MAEHSTNSVPAASSSFCPEADGDLAAIAWQWETGELQGKRVHNWAALASEMESKGWSFTEEEIKGRWEAVIWPSIEKARAIAAQHVERERAKAGEDEPWFTPAAYEGFDFENDEEDYNHSLTPYAKNIIKKFAKSLEISEPVREEEPYTGPLLEPKAYVPPDEEKPTTRGYKNDGWLNYVNINAINAATAATNATATEKDQDVSSKSPSIKEGVDIDMAGNSDSEIDTGDEADVENTSDNYIDYGFDISCLSLDINGYTGNRVIKENAEKTLINRKDQAASSPAATHAPASAHAATEESDTDATKVEKPRITPNAVSDRVSSKEEEEEFTKSDYLADDEQEDSPAPAAPYASPDTFASDGGADVPSLTSASSSPLSSPSPASPASPLFPTIATATAAAATVSSPNDVEVEVEVEVEVQGQGQGQGQSQGQGENNGNDEDNEREFVQCFIAVYGEARRAAAAALIATPADAPDTVLATSLDIRGPRRREVPAAELEGAYATLGLPQPENPAAARRIRQVVRAILDSAEHAAWVHRVYWASPRKNKDAPAPAPAAAATATATGKGEGEGEEEDGEAEAVSPPRTNMPGDAEHLRNRLAGLLVDSFVRDVVLRVIHGARTPSGSGTLTAANAAVFNAIAGAAQADGFVDRAGDAGDGEEEDGHEDHDSASGTTTTATTTTSD